MIYLEDDTFGLEQEKIIQKSRVREVFTPHKPQQTIDLFSGRSSEVKKLIQYLNTPGQHALLYGDRGVGKSSLANVVCALLLSRNIIKGEFFTKRCDSGDTFPSIIEDVLKAFKIDVKSQEKSTTRETGLGSEAQLPLIPSFKRSVTVKSSGNESNTLSPSWVAKQLKDKEGLLMVDEFDIIKDNDVKRKTSELIKQLSDNGSPFKILIVGIGENAADLTSNHPSVQRCLKETRISRMSDKELEQIIINGQQRLGLKFSESAIGKVVSVSSGYPHFTHLFALKACEIAIIEERDEISVKDVQDATHGAVEDAEGSLKTIYDNAVRSANSEQYKQILLAASLCPEDEIKAKDLRLKYEELFKISISQGTLNNHFHKLVSDGNQAILKRIAKGVYKFNDPRMSSYIRIAQSFI